MTYHARRHGNIRVQHRTAPQFLILPLDDFFFSYLILKRNIFVATHTNNHALLPTIHFT